MIHINRSTDRESAHYARRDRLYLDAGLWYFRTREGAPIGPFRYRVEAEAMLARFIERMIDARQQRESLEGKPRFRHSAMS